MIAFVRLCIVIASVMQLTSFVRLVLYQNGRRMANDVLFWAYSGHCGLDIFPFFEPLVVGRQRGPCLLTGFFQVGCFFQVELASFLYGLYDVIDLLDAIHSGDWDYGIGV